MSPYREIARWIEGTRVFRAVTRCWNVIRDAGRWLLGVDS